jgi:hypothetical protein
MRPGEFPGEDQRQARERLVVRYVRVQANPLDLLDPEDVLKAVEEAGP